MPKVIFFLPTISGYMDRVNLLMEASDQIEHMTLIVGSLDRPVDCSNHQNFKMIEIGFKRRMRPLNMWKSSRIAQNILREQDADVVLFIHREDVYYTEEEWEQHFGGRPYPRNIAEIIVAKHRNGPTGTLRLFFRDNIVRFDALASVDNF